MTYTAKTVILYKGVSSICIFGRVVFAYVWSSAHFLDDSFCVEDSPLCSVHHRVAYSSLLTGLIHRQHSRFAATHLKTSRREFPPKLTTSITVPHPHQAVIRCGTWLVTHIGLAS